LKWGFWTKKMHMEKIINGHTHILYDFEKKSIDESVEIVGTLYEGLNKRRSIRDFKPDSFPEEIIHQLIRIASTAPSGAHKQPWTFCVVKDPEIKKKIREAAENEEKLSYDQRMTDDWLNDLKPIGTNWEKPFLEIAP
jgi:iodotyrosine deiodinase